MAYVDWMIKGPNIGGCNCADGCPREFNALPTRGDGYSALFRAAYGPQGVIA